MECPGYLVGSTCCVVVAGIFSENPSSLQMYGVEAASFVRLRCRQNSHIPMVAARATLTTPPAIPAFAPVESDEDEDSKEDESEARDEVPVGVPMLSISETR